jgi:hypothetical protein
VAEGGQAEAEAFRAQRNVRWGQEVASAGVVGRLDAHGVVGVERGERRQEQLGDGRGLGVRQQLGLRKLHCGGMSGQVGAQQGRHQQRRRRGGRAGQHDAHVRAVQPVAFDVTHDVGEGGFRSRQCR